MYLRKTNPKNNLHFLHPDARVDYFPLNRFGSESDATALPLHWHLSTLPQPWFTGDLSVPTSAPGQCQCGGLSGPQRLSSAP